MNNRRKLIAALGAGALAASLPSFAQQQGKIWRVGVLSARSRPDSLDADAYGAFRQGMREVGYIEGKNLAITWLFADGKFERLPGLAAELILQNVDVIVTPSPFSTAAAQKATATIPIVFVSVADPETRGFVKTLARPGGNITGLANLTVDISNKHLEMLLSIVPQLSRVAVIADFANPTHPRILANLRAAADKSRVTILPLDAQTTQEIESAFAAMTRQNAGAVIVLQGPLFTQQHRQIAELAAKNRLPSISVNSEFAESGCLISYGPNRAYYYLRAAIFVDKIIKGAKPADLPVEQPTKFELIINGKTAKTLGLTIPQSLLIIADKVIE